MAFPIRKCRGIGTILESVLGKQAQVDVSDPSWTNQIVNQVKNIFRSYDRQKLEDADILYALKKAMFEAGIDVQGIDQATFKAMLKAVRTVTPDEKALQQMEQGMGATYDQLSRELNPKLM